MIYYCNKKKTDYQKQKNKIKLKLKHKRASFRIHNYCWFLWESKGEHTETVENKKFYLAVSRQKHNI
jgi:hypothetical protein